MHREINSMWNVYGRNPNLGIRRVVESDETTNENLGGRTVARVMDAIEIIDTPLPLGGHDPTLAYLADGEKAPGADDGEGEEGEDGEGKDGEKKKKKKAKGEPVLNPTLGLALEPLPKGISLAQLWNVV